MNKKISKILSIIALIIIAMFIIGILYSLITRNGKLAISLIIGLIFFSIIVWLMIKIKKHLENK